MDGITFGRIAAGESIGEELIYEGERHTILLGVNARGKGVRVLANMLLSMDGSKSVVVCDPKGEQLAITGSYRATLGRVVVVNSYGVLTDYYEDAEGVGFNPLARLNENSTSFNSDAALLSEAMVKQAPNERDPHWTNSARALCAVCSMEEVIAAKRERRKPNMAKVREMLCQPSEAPHPGNAFQEPSEGKGIPKMAREMMKSPHVGLRNKAAQFTEWNKEIQGIASSAKIQTECFDDPEVSENLARDDFDYADLRKETITVYLILPPAMLNRHSKFIRMHLSCALQANMRVREQHEKRILFIIDEAAAYGHLQILEDTFALTRGYGIQIMLVFQDYNQIKAIYKERTESLIGNTGITAAFGPNDMTTAEWISKRLGDKTKMNTTVTVTRGTTGGKNQSYGKNPGGGSSNEGFNDGWSINQNANTGGVKVPFMSPQELFGLPEGYLVILASGLSGVIFTYAPPYYEIPERAKLARANPYYHDVPRRVRKPKPAEPKAAPQAAPQVEKPRGISYQPDVSPSVRAKHPGCAK